MKNMKLTFAAGILAGFLAGCGGLAERADNNTKEAEVVANSSYRDVRSQAMTQRRDRVRVSETPYVQPVKRTITEPLPEIFSQPYSVTLASVVPITFAADRLSQLTGLRVVIQEDVFAYLKGGAGGAAPAAGENQEAVKQLSAQYSGGSSALGNDILVDISYTGTLSGLLDRVAASIAASWKYNPAMRGIEFYRYETRTFKLELTQSTQKVDSNVNNQSTSGAGSSQSTSTQLDVDHYQSIQADIAGMLTPQGKATVSRAASTVTVTDTPQVIQRVTTYIERYNRMTNREVLIEIKVVNVQLNKSDNRGLNLDLLRSNLTGSFSFETVRDVQGFGTLVGNVASTASGSLAPWAGSSILIDALAKQGRVSTVRNVMLRSLNGQAVPFQDTRRIAYVGQSSTLIGGNAPAQTTRQIAYETVGFSLRALPHILDDSRRMLLHMWITISNLDRLETFGTGSDIVQAPQISQTDFQERFGISSGQTLLMVGFDQQVNNSDYRSLAGDARLWALGGARESQSNQTITVFLITPIVVDAPNG